jgi:hypothetical protein
MTVREMLSKLDSQEIAEWMAFMTIRAEEMKDGIEGKKELSPDEVTAKIISMAPSINRSKRKK